MDNAVALAAIGLAGTSMAGVIWLAKYFASQLSADLKAHTKAAMRQVAASERQEQASQEVLLFMKNLNGKLAKATVQMVQEQHVEHQTVQTERVAKQRKVQG